MSVAKSAIAYSCFVMRRYWIACIVVVSVLIFSLVDFPSVLSLFDVVDEDGQRFLDLVRVSESRVIRGAPATMTTDNAPLIFKARNDPCTPDNPCTLLAVADLDQQSKLDGGKRFKSLLAEGTLYTMNDQWHVHWNEPQDIYSPLNEGGRGMELSELVLFNDRLYTVDDRTGLVMEIIRDKSGDYDVIARHVLTEGDGVSSTKGMKLEWATVKDSALWLGSFGKEYTLPDGTIKNRWPLWVAALDRTNTVKRKDWTPIYSHLRDITGAEYPGYMIHEAVEWSPYHRQWYILPRRWSDQEYVAEIDNEKGTNKLIECSESFLDCQVVEIGHTSIIANPRRGYSSVKVVPGTNDGTLIALRTEEEDAVDNHGTMRTYVQIFDRKGNILLDDVAMPFEGKFEGIAIVSFQ